MQKSKKIQEIKKTSVSVTKKDVKSGKVNGKGGKPNKNESVGEITIDPEHCTTKQISMLMGVTTQTVGRWQREGFPRKADGTFDVRDCIAFRINFEIDRMKRDDGIVNLDVEKQKVDLETRQERLKKIKGLVIDRKDHEQILGRRQAVLWQFLENGLQKNAHQFVMQPLNNVRVKFKQFAIECNKAYMDGSRQLDAEIGKPVEEVEK